MLTGVAAITPPLRRGTIDPYSRADGSKYYRARIRLADGTKARVDVPEKHTTDERRRLYAAAVQEREDERGELLAAKRARIALKAAQRDPINGETCTQYRERLDEHRAELGRGGRKHDESTWRKWIADPLGALPIAKVSRDDIEKFRDMLDERIATHKRTSGVEGIGPKTALNVWSVVTTTFSAAVASKRRDLRVRDDNPCSGVLPPERGESRRRTFIYPIEIAAVLACLDVALEWREAYAVASYLYLRPGELCALTWGDVDLAASVVHVTKAYDELARVVKAPKTRNGIRDVPIPAMLIPLLKRMRGELPATHYVVPIIHGTPESKRAPRLVAALKAAGCDRPRLYENTATTMSVNFRSLRDSGITWLALAGVDVVRAQRRAGHDNVTSTLGYMKAAEDLGGNVGAPFGPIPVATLEGLTGAGDVPPKSKRHRPRYQPVVRAKVQAKLPVENSTHRKNKAQMVEAGGVEPHGSAENKAFREDLGQLEPSRVDASARIVVGVGPSAEAGSEARSEVGRTSVGALPAAVPGERVTTLLDDLAKVVARAVADGELDLAIGLLEVAKRRGAPAGVVSLADARAKRTE